MIIIQYFSKESIKELADFYKSRTKDKGKVNSEKTQKKALLVL